MEEERKQHRQQSLDVEDDIPLIDSDYNSGSSEPSPVPTRGSTNIIKRCSSSISRHITLPIKVSFKTHKVCLHKQKLVNVKYAALAKY